MLLCFTYLWFYLSLLHLSVLSYGRICNEICLCSHRKTNKQTVFFFFKKLFHWNYFFSLISLVRLFYFFRLNNMSSWDFWRLHILLVIQYHQHLNNSAASWPVTYINSLLPLLFEAHRKFYQTCQVWWIMCFIFPLLAQSNILPAEGNGSEYLLSQKIPSWTGSRRSCCVVSFP